MRSLLSDAGVQIALVISALGLVAVLATRATAWRVPFAAVVLVAALVAMHEDLRLEWRLVVGLVLIVGAAFADAAERIEHRHIVAFVAFVTGAALVAASMPDARTWMRFVGFVAVVVAVPVTGVVDRRAPRVVPVLLLAAAIGMYVCVPDTEYAEIVLAALIPVALLVFDPALAPSPATGAVSALLVWTAVVEGRGRPGSIVGALACLGVVLLVAATRWEWRRVADVVVLVAIDAVAIAYVARVAGFRESVWAAALLALPALLLTWVALFAVSRRR